MLKLPTPVWIVAILTCGIVPPAIYIAFSSWPPNPDQLARVATDGLLVAATFAIVGATLSLKDATSDVSVATQRLDGTTGQLVRETESLVKATVGLERFQREMEQKNLPAFTIGAVDWDSAGATIYVFFSLANTGRLATSIKSFEIGARTNRDTIWEAMPFKLSVPAGDLWQTPVYACLLRKTSPTQIDGGGRADFVAQMPQIPRAHAAADLVVRVTPLEGAAAEFVIEKPYPLEIFG